MAEVGEEKGGGGFVDILALCKRNNSILVQTNLNTRVPNLFDKKRKGKKNRERYILVQVMVTTVLYLKVVLGLEMLLAVAVLGCPRKSGLPNRHRQNFSNAEPKSHFS